MRISDWSSDVCSSDLGHHHLPVAQRLRLHRGDGRRDKALGVEGGGDDGNQRGGGHAAAPLSARWRRAPNRRPSLCSTWRRRTRGSGADRSEEHTSELQSLMRISYAVFCLKKKKKKNTT